MNEHQGSAIRGALFHALRDRFCAFTDDDRIQCAGCALAATCPVARLVSTLAPGHPRGENRPRPYTIQPPVPGSGHPVDHANGHVNIRYRPGETLTFGLTLYADAMALFPYVVLATRVFEESGLGRRVQQPDGRWRRGRLTLREITAENPLSRERQAVLRCGEHQVQVPDITITHKQIAEAARTSAPAAPHHASARAVLRFLTPTRLIVDKHLVKPEAFTFRPLLHRLIDRLEALSREFSDTPLALDVPALLDAAERVQVVDNRLSWVEVSSYSTRRRASSPTGGLLGMVVLHSADWVPFWPWLLWGQFVHVGKDAVKGNGWYTLAAGG